MCLSVCLSVCPPAYLQNHMRDLYQFFCARCLWMWLGPPPAGWQNPKGNGQFWGLPGPFNSIGSLWCCRRCHVRCRGIIQSLIASCGRRDHSVCQASANRNRGKFWAQAMQPVGREGDEGVESAGKVWYLRLPCFRLLTTKPSLLLALVVIGTQLMIIPGVKDGHWRLLVTSTTVFDFADLYVAYVADSGGVVLTASDVLNSAV